MSVVSRRSLKTAIFSRFLKVAIAALNFMNEVFNSGFVPESSISELNKISTLTLSYVYEVRK